MSSPSSPLISAADAQFPCTPTQNNSACVSCHTLLWAPYSGHSGTMCLLVIAWLGTLAGHFPARVYRGHVRPLPGGRGNERTWFAPEQQLRNNVSKRSVHGKQSPNGAMTTSRGLKAGHVMTQVRQPSNAEKTSCACNTCDPYASRHTHLGIRISAYASRQLAVRCGRLNCRAKQYQESISEHGGSSKGVTIPL